MINEVPAHDITLQSRDNARIKSLDGLRGVAIFLVLTFHAYARGPADLPWVATGAYTYLFKLGFLGVDLFFLISGFVIYMTLEKCSSFKEFIVRRWLRLFPAMLIATILVYATSFFLTERPNGEIQFTDLFSGLFFIEEGILNKLQSYVHIKAIEGAFWSLFVEVKFYFIFGALYFYKKSTALRNLVILFSVSCVFVVVEKIVPSLASGICDKIFFNILSLRYFGWFSVGAFLYKAHISKERTFIYAASALMIPTTLIMFGADLTLGIACAVVYLIFYLALYNQFVSRVLSSQAFLFAGFVSYPLYLIHENAMVALTIKTHRQFDFIPGFMTPWPAILLLVLLAYLIAKYLEPQTRSLLRAWISA